jgi:hypothetical protein
MTVTIDLAKLGSSLSEILIQDDAEALKENKALIDRLDEDNKEQLLSQLFQQALIFDAVKCQKTLNTVFGFAYDPEHLKFFLRDMIENQDATLENSCVVVRLLKYVKNDANETRYLLKLAKKAGNITVELFLAMVGSAPGGINPLQTIMTSAQFETACSEYKKALSTPSISGDIFRAVKIGSREVPFDLLTMAFEGKEKVKDTFFKLLLTEYQNFLSPPKAAPKKKKKKKKLAHGHESKETGITMVHSELVASPIPQDSPTLNLPLTDLLVLPSLSTQPRTLDFLVSEISSSSSSPDYRDDIEDKAAALVLNCQTELKYSPLNDASSSTSDCGSDIESKVTDLIANCREELKYSPPNDTSSSSSSEPESDIENVTKAYGELRWSHILEELPAPPYSERILSIRMLDRYRDARAEAFSLFNERFNERNLVKAMYVLEECKKWVKAMIGRARCLDLPDKGRHYQKMESSLLLEKYIVKLTKNLESIDEVIKLCNSRKTPNMKSQCKSSLWYVSRLPAGESKEANIYKRMRSNSI